MLAPWRLLLYRLVSLYIVLALFPLAADVVTLKNGDRITGKIVKKDGGKLTVKGELTGDVTVPWDAVTAVSSDQPLTVVLPGDRIIKGPISPTPEGIEVAAGPERVTAPLAEVASIRNEAEQRTYERFLDPHVLDLWAGYFDLGFSLARGNARTNTFTNALNASRVTLSDKASIYFNQIYSTATIDGASAAAAEAIRGGWSYNKNAGSRLYASLFNDYEYDRFQNLDLRFVLGGGAGYTAIRSESTRFDLPFGFAYNHERFSTPLRRNSVEVFWGDDFTRKVNSKLSVRQSFRLFHKLSEEGATRMNFDLGAAAGINKWLSWQVTASDRYLSNPVAGRRRNDVLLTTGFRITFAR